MSIFWSIVVKVHVMVDYGNLLNTLNESRKDVSENDISCERQICIFKRGISLLAFNLLFYHMEMKH